MKNAYLIAITVASLIATACAFENKSELMTPTAPSVNVGGAGGNNSTTPVSAFTGAWGSSSLAGLPIGNCTDLKWLITEQTSSTIGGTVSATCAGGATVTATLTGQLVSADKINLTATGTILALGIPCALNLTGVGTRQTNDSMKLDYQGTHCLGSVSGSETLRRFPI
ncbi:MAG TPA: hypothetical protein VJM31_06935 [Vicinamibacterales bacterium]|nr:hypothetical protein [Vicinamibacterales bacterium]